MNGSVEELQQAVVDFLLSRGLPAVTAWSEERRPRAGQALAAVSLRAMECGAPGFQDYLGEEYDRETGQWTERYGKRAKLTFGVDIYGATAQSVRAGANTLSLALSRDGPAGLRPVELQVGETVYQESGRRYLCPTQVRFAAWLYGTAESGGAFLDFEVKGEQA